ncbi:MAG TPA: CehA/McbA family metallohydrolase [Anaerolineae bacterium]|nr:CehA/McbA family metallohydrolase [Anaerolineae bacterium]HOQ98948.1 CehA/McbA family metallohydrolase [Anaerolineae bacterium]HPL30179.1 CehA/McbA family metallohydrolase [Anaerolineae bacterium]
MTSEHVVTFRQHIGPAHTGECFLLPFEVPADASRIEVELHYDHAISAALGAGPGNVVDLGLFDARGAEFGTTEGFRGWSGSARARIFVAPDAATPGYLPGPLYPGVWNVSLGLYHVHPSGCNYTVTVRLSRGPAAEPVQLTWPVPPLKREARWYKGDLHCHSHHSEATGSLADLCGAARAQGLDFLAVTEHNTTSHHRLLGEFRTSDFLPIAGQEITTYHGHANVWGAGRWLDFRFHSDADLARVIAMAHAAGALFSANHPKTNGPPWEFGTLAGIDCLEVWQAPWFLSNYQSLAKWDELLRSGARVVAVGGSDQHQPAPGDSYAQQLGQPTTWVYAEALEPAAILGAIKAGHVFISAGPAGPQLELVAQAEGRQAMMGDGLATAGGRPLQLTARVQGAGGMVLRLVGPRGVLAEAPIPSDDFALEHTLLPRVSGYVRPEVTLPVDPEDADEPAALMMQALGNPIYIQAI